MIFINWALENVYISNWISEYSIENRLLEKKLPKVLKNIWEINNIYFINWPWSFTCLRISTLTINLINFLMKWEIKFFNINKTDLYRNAFINNNKYEFIWLYIWQKKNIWKYNIKTWEKSIEKVEKKIENCLWENTSISKQYHNELIDIKFKNNSIEILWNIFKISDFEFKIVKNLIPDYQIEPNIS